MSSLQSRTKTWTCWLSLRRFSRCFCPQGFKRDSSSWRAVDLFLWSSWNPFMDHEVDMKQILVFTGSFLMRICGWESDASLWSWSLVDDCSYRNTIRFTFCCLKELKQEMLESTLKIYLWFSLVQPIIAKFKSLCGLVSIATCFVLLFFMVIKEKWTDFIDTISAIYLNNFLFKKIIPQRIEVTFLPDYHIGMIPLNKSCTLFLIF